MNAPSDRANPTTSAPTPTAVTTRATAAVPTTVAPPAATADIGALLRRVLCHWHVVLVTMLAGAVITGQVVRTRKPAFKSETVIFYREGIGKSVTGPVDDREAVRALGTKLKEMLLAQQTLRSLIDEFGLYPEVLKKTGYADAVDQMRRKTEFKARSTDTYAISFEGRSRDEAQKVCARMAEILVAENAKRIVDDNRSATAFLDGEKRRADEELERIEREASEFLNAHPEFAGAREGLGAEVIARLRKQSEERKVAIRPGLPRRPRAESAGSAPAPAAAPAVDPVLIATRTQAGSELAQARKELAERALKFTEQHPDVRASQARVAAAEAAVQRAEEAIAAARPKEEPAPRASASAEDPYGAEERAAERKPLSGAPAAVPAASSAPRAEAEPRAAAVNLEVEWTRLGRALTLARARQSELDQKLYRAEMIASTVESGYAASIAVLDPAYKPSGPSNAPNKTVALIGLGMSILVGLALSAAWGLFLDDRVFSAAEIEGIVMVPVIGTVPKDGKKRDRKKAASAPPKPRRPRA